MNKIYWNKSHKNIFKTYIKLQDNYNFTLLNNIHIDAYMFNLKNYTVNIDFIKKIYKINKIVDDILCIIPKDIVNVINEYIDIIITVECDVMYTEEGQRTIHFKFIDTDNYFFDLCGKQIDISYWFYIQSNNFNFPNNKLRLNHDDNISIIMIKELGYYVDYLDFYFEYMCKYYNKHVSVFLPSNEHFRFDKHKCTILGGSKVLGYIQINNHKVLKNVCVILRMLISTIMKNTHGDLQLHTSLA